MFSPSSSFCNVWNRLIVFLKSWYSSAVLFLWPFTDDCNFIVTCFSTAIKLSNTYCLKWLLSYVFVDISGWLDCPPYGQPIGYMIPSKVPLDDSYNDLVMPGKRYSSKQVINSQKRNGREVSISCFHCFFFFFKTVYIHCSKPIYQLFSQLAPSVFRYMNLD